MFVLKLFVYVKFLKMILVNNLGNKYKGKKSGIK